MTTLRSLVSHGVRSPQRLAVLVVMGVASVLPAQGQVPAVADVAKTLVRLRAERPNRLQSDRWIGSGEGYVQEGDVFVCDNGDDATASRGASQHVVLNQTQQAPILVSAWSKAEGVSGSADLDYAIYLDLIYHDGSVVWGQATPFRTGSHDWQEARLVFAPDRPVKELTLHLLMRNHAGKVWFKDARLEIVDVGEGGVGFDGATVVPGESSREGFQIRDVAAGGDFVHITERAAGIDLNVHEAEVDGGSAFDVTIRDASGRDRAVTLYYAIPVPAVGTRWLEDPRRSTVVEPGREYVKAANGRYRIGANGRMSIYPFGAVVREGRGLALGLDMARPAFFRTGYNAGTAELFLAFDVALTREKPEARLSFRRFGFDADHEFRGALDAYYKLFPAAFERRVVEQGLWMPFSPISKVKGWEDFGFRFKEGHDETAWDDDHGILTFRYTEPMTWWMPMPADMPRTLAAASAEAKRLADDGMAPAVAWLSSVFHNADGEPAARFREEPWNRGAVWSMNSTPGLAAGDDFSVKWNAELRDRLYKSERRRGELDGEYVDSSEGYVTDELDFRRENFARSDSPLTFSSEDHRPAVFRGTIAFEYIRGIADDVHGMGKLMMANATPDRLCWLAPLLDVMGTEADWNPGGRWRPLSDADLLMRRALCKGKPFGFLMNSEFDRMGPDVVENYMRRCAAYGMFPGFFSHNAADGAYFTRPELYERDRPLFRKYVPLCKLVAEAGWEPITRARSNEQQVYVERFGDRLFTVFNDSDERRTSTITFDEPPLGGGRELVGGIEVEWRDRAVELVLDPGGLAVLEFPAKPAR